MRQQRKPDPFGLTPEEEEAERIEELKRVVRDDAAGMLASATMEGWVDQFTYHYENGQVTVKHYDAGGHVTAEFILTITAEEAP